MKDNAVAAPLPPQFMPKGGTYDCPVAVAMTDINAANAIYFTTDGTTPTPGSGSTKLYSSPVSVTQRETIKAVAVNKNAGTSAVAQALYVCQNDFVSFKVTIETGDDDARTDSAITATLKMNSGKADTWCPKYSDNGAFAPCSQSHPGITWKPYSTNAVGHNFDSSGNGPGDFGT